MRSLKGLVMVLGMIGTTVASSPEMIKLPPPQTEGGLPLMQALKARHSSREFAARPLPKQLLSDLLWAANGVNRPDSGKRTAPTAKDMREITVYAVTAEGAFRFAPEEHALYPVVPQDIRALTGTQEFVGLAPLDLVYVAELDRMDGSEESKNFYAAVDTGFIAGNVYLFCASAGLATVVRGSVERKKLASALKLTPHQQIILAQTVGYPK